MKCPKDGCGGALYRFRPKHLVTACRRSETGVLMELSERQWQQVGLVCGTCGFMEFYAQEPVELLREPGWYFECTEPGA